MDGRVQYFLWNNRQSFGRGWGRNVRVTEEGLCLGEKENTGTYYTRICDSRQPAMQWDRLMLEAEPACAGDLHISVYTSEEPYIHVGNKRYDLHELWKDSSLSVEQKDILLEDYRRMELSYGQNQLLQGVTGRYLWIRLRQAGTAGRGVRIRRIQIFFPRKCWTLFLPELYQGREDSFLERFLGIFQYMYEDMNHRIAEIPGLYCADNAPAGMLEELAKWLSVEEPYLWNEKQLRYLIQHGIQLAGMRGTTEYIRRILWLYTGVVPYIVEYWHWAYGEMDSRRRNVLEELYGSDSFCAVALVPGYTLKEQDSMAVLERLAEHGSPAHMDVRIEILQPHIFLDRYSYLGINSYLEEWGEALLDGQRVLPFVVLKENGHER